MSFRADIREQTERLAAAELEHNGTYLALVSSELVEELHSWSRPVRMRAEAKTGGIVVLVSEPVEAP